MKCWICGAEAKSSEHKFKKSDFKKLWGDGPYRGGDTIAHVTNGQMYNVHGPDSKRAKYPPNLCNDCNNSYTQPFDLAYDTFIEWFELNKEAVATKRVINWEEVYGTDFPLKQLNLYKYFAKCTGCRIADHGHQVPNDIVELLNLQLFQTGLRVTFSINEDYRLLPEEDMGLAIHPLYYVELNENGEKAYFCGHSYKWLNFNYYYMFNPDIGLGSPWVADSQFVYLGFQYTLDEKQRQEFLEKITNRTTSHSSSPAKSASLCI